MENLKFQSDILTEIFDFIQIKVLIMIHSQARTLDCPNLLDKLTMFGATAVSPPPFFMIDYDREFHADSEKYKNIALKINGKCSNSTSKF